MAEEAAEFLDSEEQEALIADLGRINQSSITAMAEATHRRQMAANAISTLQERIIFLNQKVSALELQMRKDRSDRMAKESWYGRALAVLLPLRRKHNQVRVLANDEPERGGR